MSDEAVTRPDDSGEFDDATLEAIIRESVDLGITDPLMRRDLRWMFAQLDEARAACCLNQTHTTHYSDGYKVRCKIHDTEHTTDTGWNR